MLNPYSVAYSAVLKAAGLEKTAARREIKILRELIGKGNVDEAANFAKKLWGGAENVEGYIPRRHIKELGAGGEGVADLVTSRDHGLEVLKQYNPNSQLVNDFRLDVKEDFLKKMQDLDATRPDPRTRVARFYGTDRVGSANPVRATRHEYVPGKSLAEHRRVSDNVSDFDAQRLSDYRGFQDRVDTITPKAMPSGRYIAADTFSGHGGNVIRDPNTGQNVVIDALPMFKNLEGPDPWKMFDPAKSTPTNFLNQKVHAYQGTFTPGTPGMSHMSGPEIKAWAHRGVRPEELRRGTARNSPNTQATRAQTAPTRAAAPTKAQTAPTRAQTRPTMPATPTQRPQQQYPTHVRNFFNQ